jgi:hypothetical protein
METRIEGVAESVPQQVETQDREHDGEAGKEDEMRG